MGCFCSAAWRLFFFNVIFHKNFKNKRFCCATFFFLSQRWWSDDLLFPVHLFYCTTLPLHYFYYQHITSVSYNDPINAASAVFIYYYHSTTARQSSSYCVWYTGWTSAFHHHFYFYSHGPQDRRSAALTLSNCVVILKCCNANSLI
jgi:hypothetical protein